MTTSRIQRPGLKILRGLLILLVIFSAGSTEAQQPQRIDQLILDAIQNGSSYTDADLLLVTTNLRWFQDAMKGITPGLLKEIDRVRVNAAARAAQLAAERMGEPLGNFLPTGSWNAGRDYDFLYIGPNKEKAKRFLAEAYAEVTAELIAEGHKNRGILTTVGGTNIRPPTSLSAESMSIVVMDLPDFGYADLEELREWARAQLAGGADAKAVQKRVSEVLQEKMHKNILAQIDSQGPDFYKGAAGQQWWVDNYLNNPDKVRIITFDPVTKSAVFLPGGIDAVPREIVGRLGFASAAGKTDLAFAVKASNLAMFFDHEFGGLKDTAKYVDRIADNLNLATLVNMEGVDVDAVLAAVMIGWTPQDASKILAKFGFTEEQVREGVKSFVYKQAQDQLIEDATKLTEELRLLDLADDIDDIEKMIRRQKLQFDLNDLSNGLAALSDAPDDIRKRLMDALEKGLGTDDAAQAVLTFVKKQMNMLADPAGRVTYRTLEMLREMGEITYKEYIEARVQFTQQGVMPEGVAKKVRTARSQMVYMSMAMAMDGDAGPEYVDRVLEAWHQARSDAIIQKRNQRLVESLDELANTPPSELKKLGWNDAETIAISKMRQRLQLRELELARLAGGIDGKMVKIGLTRLDFRKRVHLILFNPDYTQFGEAGNLGPIDVFMSVASGYLETYDILFNQQLTPQEETDKLWEAWAKALPFVGELMEGTLKLNQAWFEEDEYKQKRLVLEAGMWVTIAWLGVVPGGEIPALALSVIMIGIPAAEGAYDASRAQDLVQAWVESGVWSEKKPYILKSLRDRNKKPHDITFEDLLTEKGMVPYFSTRADGILGGWFDDFNSFDEARVLPPAPSPLYDYITDVLRRNFGETVTINGSIRLYAEKYVFPRHPGIADLRKLLKTIFPDFDDRIWSDEDAAKKIIEQQGGTTAMKFFKPYHKKRTELLTQTIAHLKQWAEDERRAAEDYEAEVERLRNELKQLEQEIGVTSLLRHADQSVEAYLRVVKNVWEQESLALSKIRIYEYYLGAYRGMLGKIRQIRNILDEVPELPDSWHLTGFPELDKPLVENLLIRLQNSRRGVFQHINAMLANLGTETTSYDPTNECHHEVFVLLTNSVYKVRLAEHYAEYFNSLSGQVSVWEETFEEALAAYEGIQAEFTRDSIPEPTSEGGFVAVFTNFITGVSYKLAAGEAGQYAEMAKIFELTHLPRAMSEYEQKRKITAPSMLRQCTENTLEIELELIPWVPDKGTAIKARVRVSKGDPPKEHYWFWKLEGAVSSPEAAGPEIDVVVNGPGTITVQLVDDLVFARMTVLASDTANVVPKDPNLPEEEPPEVDGDEDVDDPDTGTRGADEPGDDTAGNADAPTQDDPGAGAGAAGGTVTIDTRKLSFAGTAPDIWEGGNYDNTWDRGYYAKRAKATRSKTDGHCQWDGHVNGEIWANINPSFVPKSAAEIAAKVEEVVAENKRWNRESEVNAIALGAFKGQIVHTKVRFKGGHGSMEGYRGSSVEALGRGWLIKGDDAIELKYNITGGGCFDNTHRPFLESQAAAAQGEAKAILSSLRLVESGSVTTIPYTGPKLDGSDMLEVSLTASPDGPSFLGETVAVQALVNGGSPPYTYSWTGDHAGTGSSVSFASRKAGDHTLSVTVTDARDQQATVQITITVEAVSVEIRRTIPSSGPVPFGAPAGFEAVLKGGAANLILLWQPHPEVEFTPFEKSTTTSALFPQPGRFKVWVEVFREEAGQRVTVGESDQLEVEVAAPQLVLRAEPTQPLVGEMVTVTVESNPEISEDLASFWWELDGNALNAGPLASDREYTFKPMDTQPITVTAHGKAIEGGDDLGEARLTITAKPYRVTVSEPRLQGPKPRIWKDGGLVEVDNAIAVFQDVFISADVSPAPANPPARFSWSVSPEGCVLASPESRETRAQASRTGTYTVSVEVEDSKGLVLGTGSGQIAVTISQDQLGSPTTQDGRDKLDSATASWQQGDVDGAVAILTAAASAAPNDPTIKRTLDEYKQKKARIDNEMKQAKENARLGKLDEAIANAQAAQRENPGNPEVSDFIEEMQRTKAHVHRELLEIEGLMEESEFPAAQKRLFALMNAHSYYPPIQNMEQKLGKEWRAWDASVNAALGEVRMASERRDFKECLEMADETRRTLHLLPSHLETLANSESYCRTMYQKKEAARRLFESGEAKLHAYDYQGAVDDITEGLRMTGNLWNVNTDTTPHYYQQVAAEAREKQKKLDGHLAAIRWALDQDPIPGRIERFEDAIVQCDQARALKPDQPGLPDSKRRLEEKLRLAMSAQTGQGGSSGQGVPSEHWHLTPDGFPLIAGMWEERSGSTVHSVRIEQNGGRFSAHCTYQIRGSDISWTQTGTIDRSGKVVSELQHLNIPESSTGYRQHREMQLSKDGDVLDGYSSFQGGGHRLHWTLAEASNTSDDAISKIVGVWEHTIHTHTGCDRKESFCKRYDLPMTFSRGTDGVLEARSDKVLMKGPLAGRNFKFEMYWAPTGAYHGAGHFAFDGDFTAFDGTFEDINGHRGTWSGSRDGRPPASSGSTTDRNTAIRKTEEANALYKQGKSREAVAACNAALKADPTYSEAHRRKGWANWKLKKYEESVNDFTRAIEFDPENPLTYNGRATSLYNLKRYDESIRDAGRAITLNPDYANAHVSRGLCRLAKGNRSGAERDFRRASELDPGSVYAFAGLGRALEQLGDFRGARSAYKRALEIMPNYERAIEGLARVKENLAPRATPVPTKAPTKKPTKRPTRVPTPVPTAAKPEGSSVAGSRWSGTVAFDELSAPMDLAIDGNNRVKGSITPPDDQKAEFTGRYNPNNGRITASFEIVDHMEGVFVTIEGEFKGRLSSNTTAEGTLILTSTASDNSGNTVEDKVDATWKLKRKGR